MVDKNGVELQLNDKVTDVHGRSGTLVNVNGCQAIMFENEGKVQYAFAARIIENQICKEVA